MVKREAHLRSEPCNCQCSPDHTAPFYGVGTTVLVTMGTLPSPPSLQPANVISVLRRTMSGRMPGHVLFVPCAVDWCRGRKIGVGWSVGLLDVDTPSFFSSSLTTLTHSLLTPAFTSHPPTPTLFYVLASRQSKEDNPKRTHRPRVHKQSGLPVAKQ